MIMAKKQTRRVKSTKRSSPKRKTINKSPKRKANTRKSSTNKHATYKTGKQDLSISYNYAGSKFVFTLTNNEGQLGSAFQVNGKELIKMMSLPPLVVSSL
mgnify:CR=1 FL=1|jgi:hypothetical protein